MMANEWRAVNVPNILRFKKWSQSGRETGISSTTKRPTFVSTSRVDESISSALFETNFSETSPSPILDYASDLIH